MPSQFCGSVYHSAIESFFRVFTKFTFLVQITPPCARTEWAPTPPGVQHLCTCRVSRSHIKKLEIGKSSFVSPLPTFVTLLTDLECSWQVELGGVKEKKNSIIWLSYGEVSEISVFILRLMMSLNKKQ